MFNIRLIFSICLVLSVGSTQTFADRYSSGGKGAPVQTNKDGTVTRDSKTEAEGRVGEAARTAPTTSTQMLQGAGATAPTKLQTMPNASEATKPSASSINKPSLVGGPRIIKKADSTPAQGSSLKLLDDAATKAEKNGLADVAEDIRKYRAVAEKQLAAGGVEDGKLVLAQRMNDMVDSLVTARGEGRCDGACNVIVKEALRHGDNAEVEQLARYFGKASDGKANLDKDAIQGLGTLVTTWKGHFDAAKKAGKSDTEASLEAGRKTDEWLLTQLGKDGYGDFCKASKAGKASASVTRTGESHGGSRANTTTRSTKEEQACPLRYMNVCNLAA